MARATARRAATSAPVRDQPRVGPMLEAAREARPGSSAATREEIVRRQHDLAQLHAFAHRWAALGLATRSSSRLDHDGDVAPWLELAHDRDLVVHHIELNPDTTLDYDDLAAKLGSGRVRVVAFAWASTRSARS